MMMFGSLHFRLAIIIYDWFLTIWLVILFFERKKIVKQKWLKGWGNLNQRSSCSMKIQYGSDKSSRSYILLPIFFLLCILFWSLFVVFVNLWFHSRFSCIVLLYVCRYNQIDRHLKNKALQCIIFGELKGTCLLWYDKTFNEEKEAFEKIEQPLFVLLWSFVLFLVSNFYLFLGSITILIWFLLIQMFLPRKYQLLLMMFLYMLYLLVIVFLFLFLVNFFLLLFNFSL
jgi:hypothetical protein